MYLTPGFRVLVVQTADLFTTPMPDEAVIRSAEAPAIRVLREVVLLPCQEVALTVDRAVLHVAVRCHEALLPHEVQHLAGQALPEVEVVHLLAEEEAEVADN